MCCFIVGLPLNVKIEIDLEVDAGVYRSDIDPVMLENLLQDSKDHSW
jgi:hypothetical protein